MSEKEKMLNGDFYDPTDPELAQLRINAHNLCLKYNQTSEQLTEQRDEFLRELMPNISPDSFIQGPVHVDYGKFIYAGSGFYANFNFTVLDSCPVHIGHDVMIGPNVSLMTAMHPLRFQERNLKTRKNGEKYTIEYAKPITIGDNCWIASNVTVIGGVNIGNGCVIGAGSVVTKDIPDNCLAVGNPCRIVKTITDADDMHGKTK